MTTRLTDQWAEWIEDALPMLALGERVNYDLTMVITEQGPAVGLTLFSPGVLLGSTMHSVAVLQNPSVVTQDGLESVLRGLLEALATERTNQTKMPGTGQNVVPLNGQGSGAPLPPPLS